MKTIVEDFVNRSDQLTFLRDMARQKVEPRILVVEAESGMGKTYLLKEFRAECQDERIEGVLIDFEERYEDPGYMYIIKEAWSQLGPFGFNELAQTIEDIVNSGIRKNGRSGSQDALLDKEAFAGKYPQMPQSPVVPSGSPAGQSSVNIYGGTNTIRDVAGRDIVHIIQVIYQEDPFVQTQARTWITEAFRQCLIRITAERNIVFFIDHWQKAESETRHWLANSLVKWAADGLLPKASVVVAGLEGVDLEPRRLMKRVQLPELSEDFIKAYLVDICGLPMEEVANFIRVAGGIPFLLNMGVKRWRREKNINKF